MKQADPTFAVAYAEPFGLGARYRDARPAGQTIAQIVASLPLLPPEFERCGVVCINGDPVPKELWRHVRPKPGADRLPVAVTLHMAPGGGGGNTAKAIGGLVAALALVIITGGIASGALGTALGIGAIGPGTGLLGAQGLAGAVGLIGALGLSALSAPPSVAAQAGPTSLDNVDAKQAAGATGNVLEPGGAIPRVIGTRKVFPPFTGQPIVELVGDDEYVEALFALNGPHAMSDIRIDGVAIAEAEDVDYETREGWPDDPPVTLTVRQGRMAAPQIELSVHKVLPATQNQLLDPASPDLDLPVWHGMVSRRAPDEVWVHLLLPNGLSVNGSTATDVGIPFRIRFRQKGSGVWTQIPEVHLSDSILGQRRRAILFRWRAAETLQTVPTKSGWIYAHGEVPGQATLPATSGWTADSYFLAASGNAYLSNGNESATKLKNINLFSNRIEVYLDPAQFPQGTYEIEIKRGAAYLVSSLTFTTYSYAGSVKDFFTYSGVATPVIPMSRANLADRTMIVRVVSVWNEYPVLRPGLALLAVKALNRQVQNVSMLASGYVRDWNGSAWATWTTTSNPAPHYVDILSGAQNIDPLPADLRDDDGLVAWRTLCASNGWTCDTIIDDFRTQDALALLASCGYARPYQSDIYGVTVDSDRSSDDPVQVFSRRNAANFRYERAFARVPDGLIVNHADGSADYDVTQTIVYQRDRSLATTGLLETTSFEGLVVTAAVEARALFDLDQANARATFYYLDTDMEAIVCRRGDLVAVQHDILDKRCGDGLIRSKTVSGGNITGFTLDSKIPITNEPDMHAVSDMHAVADMHEVGVTTGIAIRRNDGTISTHLLSNPTGEDDVLTLATPFADVASIEGLADNDNTYGSMVVAGRVTAEYRRLLVAAIVPQADLQASLVLVDEAPALVRYAA